MPDMAIDAGAAEPGAALGKPDLDHDRNVALERARSRVAAEADARAETQRRKARNARIGKVIVAAMFVIMLFERAVNGGWF